MRHLSFLFLIALIAGALVGCDETCADNVDCLYYETCVDGFCGERSLSGEACDDDDDCYYGYACSAGICSLSGWTPNQPNPNQPNPNQPEPPPEQGCDGVLPAGGVQLNVAEFGQECTQWCWAATITMAGNYFGQQFYGCELVSAYTGQACCNYQACGYAACNQPAQPQGMSASLQWLGIQSQLSYQPLTASEMERELALGRPVIVGYQNSFSGHVVLVTGVSADGLFHVVDPYYGVFDVTYEQLRWGYQGGGTQWAMTWHGLSANGIGCPGVY